LDDVTYLLPIRRHRAAPPEELTHYLRTVARTCDLLIVDGSDEATFGAHRRAWGGFARHVPPDAAVDAKNGKARGVLTGLQHGPHERIVIADDDVRYPEATLHHVAGLLDVWDLVSPQNHFEPLVWHAAWDTARTLLNRAVGHDFPGTLAVRRSALERTHGYDGNALFENLELIRTVHAAGGRVLHAQSVFVPRRPPTFAHFLRQRPRQAYDEWARPHRLVLGLLVVPGAASLIRRRGWRNLAALSAGAIALAQYGRIRNDGRTVFPARTAIFAPAWILERGVTSWLAVLARLRGGCRYNGQRLVLAAHSLRRLHASARRVSGEALTTR
jgi:hypothetical protein